MLEISGIKVEDRIVELHQMHDEIIDYGDEALMMYWFEEAVPDGADETDFIDIAMDEELWSGAVAAYEFLCSAMR